MYQPSATKTYWSRPADEMIAALGGSRKGLDVATATERSQRYGRNSSAVLGFIQEYRATDAVEKLRQRVSVKSTVLRGGQRMLIPSEQEVPGDIVELTAGSLIPCLR